MKRIIPLFAALAAILASCAVLGPGDENVEIRYSLGPEAARALDTGWTDGSLPAFSSVTLTVSARDMRTVSRTVTGNERSISLLVPYGRDRRVEIVAVPASSFVSSFYGSEIVDLRRGTTLRLAIQIELSGTGILLPDAVNGTLYEAMSIAGPRSASGFQKSIGPNEDFEYDDRGRIYLGSPSGIARLGSLASGSLEALPLSHAASKGITYDPASSRAYYISSQNPYPDELCFVDVTQPIPQSVLVLRSPIDVQRWGQALASGDGYLYAVSCIQPQAMTNFRIVKLSINASGGTASYTEIESVAFEALGLTVPLVTGGIRYLKAEDMLLKDGTLFILATDVYSGPYMFSPNDYYSRGKVIALSAATLDLLWERGWSGEGNNFPADPATQFYGPRRIVGIMPRKIFIADDGYSLVGTSSVNQDRVFGIDTGSGAITNLGLSGEVPFFNDFSYTSIC